MTNGVAEAIKEAGGPARVADCFGVSVQAACFWRDGKRKFPSELAARLERAAGRRVRRWHMFPKDWHEIWPELVGTEGAPPPPGADPA